MLLKYTLSPALFCAGLIFCINTLNATSPYSDALSSFLQLAETKTKREINYFKNNHVRAEFVAKGGRIGGNVISSVGAGAAIPVGHRFTVGVGASSGLASMAGQEAGESIAESVFEHTKRGKQAHKEAEQQAFNDLVNCVAQVPTEQLNAMHNALTKNTSNEYSAQINAYFDVTPSSRIGKLFSNQTKKISAQKKKVADILHLVIQARNPKAPRSIIFDEDE